MSYDELPLDLDEIEERAAAATPGPWTSFVEGRDHASGDDFVRTGGMDMYVSQSSASTTARASPAAKISLPTPAKTFRHWSLPFESPRLSIDQSSTLRRQCYTY